MFHRHKSANEVILPGVFLYVYTHWGPHLQMPFILESQREFPATYFTSPSDRNAILTYYSPGYGILPLPVGIWANFCDWRELVLFPI